MTQTRCKFRCIETSDFSLETDDGLKPARHVRLTAVSADGRFPNQPDGSLGLSPAPENAIFGKYTPNGDLQMTVLSPNADFIEPGKDYYLTIESA